MSEILNKAPDRISRLNDQIRKAVEGDNRLRQLFFPEGYSPIQLSPIPLEPVRTDNLAPNYAGVVQRRNARENNNFQLNLQSLSRNEDIKEEREKIGSQMKQALDEIAKKWNITYNEIEANSHLANDLCVILQEFFQGNSLFQGGLRAFFRQVLNYTPLADEVGTRLIMAKAVDHPDRESILNSLIPVLKTLTTDKFQESLADPKFQEKVKASLELLARCYSHYISSWINSPTEDNAKGINLSAKVFIILFSRFYPNEQT